MRFISLFSGIEAASVAWKPLGWECVAVAEIEAFPSALLRHHYPDVPNLGNVSEITKQQIEDLGHIDAVVMGFPCQDVSIAGNRKGLKHADGTLTRSGLFFTAMWIVQWSKARWTIGENVPGLFSANEGRDFAAVVGELAGTAIDVPRDGWRTAGVAVGPAGLVEWFVLDAQYTRVASHPTAVPQRRRRVFFVRDTGDWNRRPPLFLIPESLQRNPPPRRESRERIAPTLSARTKGGGGLGTDFDLDGGQTTVPEVCGTLSDGAHNGGGLNGQDAYSGSILPVHKSDADRVAHSVVCHAVKGGDPTTDNYVTHAIPGDARPLLGKGNSSHAEDQETYVAQQIGTFQETGHGWFNDEPVAQSIRDASAGGSSQHANLVAHALTGEGFDASEDGTGRGTPLIAVNARQDPINTEGVALALDTDGSTQAIAFTCKDHGSDATRGVAPTLRGMTHDSSHANGGGQIAVAIQAGATRENSASGPDGAGVRTDGVAYTIEARPEVQAVAFQTRIARNGRGQPEEVCPALNGVDAGETSDMRPCVATVDQIQRYAVRRLTPRECERLMGLPDDYTKIPTGPRKTEAKDGPRYKALGNSFAVNCLHWIGQRIQQVSGKQ